MRERPAGPGRSSLVTALVVIVLALAWLAWPLWSSTTAPDARQQSAESQPALFALIGLSGLLTAVVHREAGIRTIQAIALLAVVNTALRPLLGAGSSGLEPVYLLPIVAGVYAGPAAGWLVGFWSALASSIWLGVVASPLAAQSVVWALVGAAGGLLRPLPHLLATLCAPVLGAVTTMLVGAAYNLPSWSVAEPGDITSFVTGADPLSNTARLLLYTLQTSWAVDLVRCLGTAVALLVCTGPLLTWLQAVFGRRRPDPRELRVLHPLRSQRERTNRQQWRQTLWPKEKPSD